MRLEQIPSRIAQLAEDCEVTERLTDASRKVSEVSGKVYDQMSVAGEAARRGAAIAYRTALEHPRTSIGAVIVAATLVGGVLWYVFGAWRKPPVQRRRAGTHRMRAGTERRRRTRSARAAA